MKIRSFFSIPTKKEIDSSPGMPLLASAALPILTKSPVEIAPPSVETVLSQKQDVLSTPSILEQMKNFKGRFEWKQTSQDLGSFKKKIKSVLKSFKRKNVK